MKNNSKTKQINQQATVDSILTYAYRRYDSQQRMRIFEENAVEELFKSLDSNHWIILLKDLWEGSDYPSRQLDWYEFDALSMVDTYSLPNGEGARSKNLYRIYMSDKELDEDTYDEVWNAHGLELSGAWFRTSHDALAFLDELCDTYYSFRWGGIIPKYVYWIEVPADVAKVCWEGQTGRGKEVVVNGFNEGAEFDIRCVGARRDNSKAA